MNHSTVVEHFFALMWDNSFLRPWRETARHGGLLRSGWTFGLYQQKEAHVLSKADTFHLLWTGCLNMLTSDKEHAVALMCIYSRAFKPLFPFVTITSLRTAAIWKWVLYVSLQQKRDFPICFCLRIPTAILAQSTPPPLERQGPGHRRVTSSLFQRLKQIQQY